MPETMPFVNWWDAYVQTPGKLNVEAFEKTWGIQHSTFIAEIYRRDLSRKRREFWDGVYQKLQREAYASLRKCYIHMVEDLASRRERLIEKLRNPESSAGEVARVSDALSTVSRDLLRARGWPEEASTQDPHNLYPHPEND